MSINLSLELYRDALEDLPAGVYLVDPDRRILLWSSGAETLTGYLRQEVVGRSCRDVLLMHCDENLSPLCGDACPLQQTILDGHSRLVDVFLRHKDGQRVPVSLRAVPLRDDRGIIIGALECFDKRVVCPTADPVLRGVNRGAFLDELTRLPDHASTIGCLRAHLEEYETSRVPFGVVSITVNTLDSVRHADGRNAVNALLYATAQTLAGAMGPNDVIGRWSDERFVAILTGCTAPALLRAATMMKRLVHLEGVPWWGDRLTVSVSMGGAIVRTGDTPELLIGRAESALDSSLGQPEDSVVVV